MQSYCSELIFVLCLECCVSGGRHGHREWRVELAIGLEFGFEYVPWQISFWLNKTYQGTSHAHYLGKGWKRDKVIFARIFSVGGL